MRKMLLLFFLLCVAVHGEYAWAKKLKLYNVTIIHYDNSKSKGLLYEIVEKGIILVEVKEFLRNPSENNLSGMNDGSIKTRIIPFDQVKKMVIRRRNAAGRAMAFGAIVGAVAGTAITVDAMISVERNESCGCGPPIVLAIPALAAICAVPGALIGTLPLVSETPDPEHPYESIQQKFSKYSLVRQLSASRQ